MNRLSLLKKVIAPLLVLALIVVGVSIVWGTMTKQDGEPSQGQAPTRTPSVPVPSPSAVPRESVPSDTPKNREALVVNAAKESVEFLATGSLNPSLREQYVERYVAPASRPDVSLTLDQLGPILATSDLMGYDSVDAAANNAYYYELVREYKLLSMSSSKASVSLLVETHWISAAGSEYVMVSTTTVDMQNVDGAWMYASSQTDPVPDELKPELEGATYDQLVALYRPYLEGYADVSSVNDSGR